LEGGDSLPIVTIDDTGNFQLQPVDLDSWKGTFRRVLLNGPPLSGKTTSLLTFPAKRHILIAPGELGHSSIREDENTKVYFWQFDPSSSNIQYMKTWVQVQKLTNEILGGKFGEVETFAIDGLHKLMFTIMCANGWTPDTEGKVYPKYYRKFNEYLSPILASPIPYVVVTCYDGREALEPGSKLTQVFPQLPGALAKDIMGTFPCVFHSSRQGDGTNEKFVWELRASGSMQAAGLHLPIDLKTKFPATLPQNWGEVEKIINA
jgi:hypothetical protein